MLANLPRRRRLICGRSASEPENCSKTSDGPVSNLPPQSFMASASAHLDRQPNEVDEAQRVFLVIAGAHREAGDVQIVKRIRALAADRLQVAFVQAHGDFAREGSATFSKKASSDSRKRRKPQPVVDHFGIIERQLLFVVQRGAVERERFEFAHSRHQDSAARRFVAAARFHADKAILDKVNAADAMFAADYIQLFEQRNAAELLLPIQRNRNAILEADGDFRRLVGASAGLLLSIQI